MLPVEKIRGSGPVSNLLIGNQWRGLATNTLSTNNIPETFVLNAHDIANIEQLWKSGTAPVAELGRALITQADRFLEHESWSVAEKTTSPTDQRNHEFGGGIYSSDPDLFSLIVFSEAVFTLAFSAAITNTNPHYEGACSLLNTWFACQDNKRQPALAPIDRDLNAYRAITNSRYLIYIVEAIRLLEFRERLSIPLKTEIQNWFTHYSEWLTLAEAEIRAGKSILDRIEVINVQQVICAWVLGDNSLERAAIANIKPYNVPPLPSCETQQAGAGFPFDYPQINGIFEAALVQRIEEARQILIHTQQTQIQELVSELNRTADELNKVRASAVSLKRKYVRLGKVLETSERFALSQQKKIESAEMRLNNLLKRPSYRLAAPLRMMEKVLKGYTSRFKKRRKNQNAFFKLYSRGITIAEPLLSRLVGTLYSSRQKESPYIDQLRRRLRNFGIIQPAIADLQSTATNGKTALLRGQAAWEISCHYLDFYDSARLGEIQSFLTRVKNSPFAKTLADRLVVMQAEALAHEEPAAAIHLLNRSIKKKPTADLWLALGRLMDSDSQRLHVLNECMRIHRLPLLHLVEASSPDISLYDRLSCATRPPTRQKSKPPLVTVLVPAYNSRRTIETTIRGLVSQTYKNLEILVIDDQSSDDTKEVVQKLIALDSRIRLLATETNSGPYVARNIGLRAAKGELVTCNDADDWSHPLKIAIQVAHLVSNPSCIANTSQQARIGEDLRCHRRGNYGFFIQINLSSLLFRREPVMEKLGYWDCVRFAGDSEFFRRLKVVFGKSSVIDLASGPLSFQRQSAGSITASATLGYNGFKYGARLAYDQLNSAHHKSGRSLKYNFPQKSRPFVAPEPMRLPRDINPTSGVRKFDVVIASEFRLSGGTNQSNAEEIKAQINNGMRTGLVQICLYHLNDTRSLNPNILKLIDGDLVDLLVYGETIECDLLIIRLPWVLQHRQVYLPHIDARAIRVIINQPPKRDYGVGSEALCDLKMCEQNLRAVFGKAAIWHPIGPLVRDVLTTHHSEELDAIGGLGSDDWSNIIHVEEWKRPDHSARNDGRIRICRHSRDQYVKWPADRKTLLAAYPSYEPFEIHVLGGAKIPENVLGGRLPPNWYVHEFGSVNPAEFLATNDVFVYYTHLDWIESFGRSILEAMAVGVPVFLPPQYKLLFKEAAIYAEPEEVAVSVQKLMADKQEYTRQVDVAHQFINLNFGYPTHLRRILPLLPNFSLNRSLSIHVFRELPNLLRLFCEKQGIRHEFITGKQKPLNSLGIEKPDSYGLKGVIVSPEADSFKNVRVSCLHVTKGKRFSNSLIQLSNVIALAAKNNVKKIVLPELWYLPQEAFTLLGVKIYPVSEQAHLVAEDIILSGEFFYKTTLSPLYDGAISRSSILEALRPIIKIKNTEPPLPSDEIVIHIRSGDVFDNTKKIHPGYGQPPFAYYTLILKSGAWKRVHLVYEDRLNPIIEKLEHYLAQNGVPFTVQSGSLKKDIEYILRAHTLVGGTGTFLPGIVTLSQNVRRLYSFGKAPSDLAKNIEQITIEDQNGGYKAAVLSGNWRNDEWQRELMETYPESALLHARPLQISRP